MNPHGAYVSKYGAAASALLHMWIDPTMDAAFASAKSGKPAWAFYSARDTRNNMVPSTWTTGKFGTVASPGERMYGDLYIEIFQPGITATNQKAILAPTTPLEVEQGRAFVTGYVCANQGCHMNGAFNSLTTNAFYGEWRFLSKADSTGSFQASAITTPVGAPGGFIPMGDEPGAVTGSYAPAQNRTDAIKGHTLYAYTNPDLTKQTAWAASATCKSCHDQIDARLGVESFPHSNRVWEIGAGQPGGETTYGGSTYKFVYDTAAWFDLAEYYGAPKFSTNTRSLTGDGPTVQQLTVGMDGACLKCHDTNDPTLGVGKSF